MKLARRTVLAAGAAALTPASAGGAERLITGVNLAGLEFNDRKLPGRLDHDYVAPTGARRLEPFTRWAREHGKRGFLGEFGGGPDEACAREITALLEHVDRNRDVWLGWTCWAGGPWWDDDYPLSLEPASLENARDRPQMAVLRRYFE